MTQSRYPRLLRLPFRLARPLAARIRKHPGLSRWALRLVPDLPLQIRIPTIGPFRIRLKRHRYFWLREPLASERVPFTLLRSMVQPGDVVYDGGANIGLYSRLFATLGAGEVIAFEPMAGNRELLHKNLALGGATTEIRCLPVAVSDRDGEAEFQVDDVQSTSGTLDRVTGGGASEGRANVGLPPKVERVRCRSIDSLVESGEIPPPDVIKLDVEGAEALVLDGALRTLRRHRPRLMVEIHGLDAAREVTRKLLDLGYTCRGAVSPHLIPGGYGPVDEEVLGRFRQRYDLRFLAAAMDPGVFPDEV